MSKMVTIRLDSYVGAWSYHSNVIFLIHLSSIAPQSTGSRLSGLYLTTRNTLLLMQQIAGAQAEAIPQLPMKQGEIRAPRSAWKWATAAFKWESEKKSEKRWGAGGKREGKGSVSVTINCFQWQSSTGWLPALHQTHACLYACVRVCVCARASECSRSEADIKVQPLFLIMLHLALW